MTTQPDSEQRPSPRPFTLRALVALVVANMVGAGVFTTSGYTLNDLGDPWWVLAAWAVGGVVAMCGALSYGMLARHLAESGGEFLFLSRLVHPLAGFLAGWVSLVAGFTGATAFAATTFELYAIPAESRPDWLPRGALAVLLVLACTLLHAQHVVRGVRWQSWVVGGKVVLLCAFLVFACSRVDGWHGAPAPEWPSEGEFWFAFASSLTWISLSYSGFNAAVYVASEAHAPARLVPRALWVSTLLVTAFYLLLNAVFVLAPAPEAVAGVGDVSAQAARALGGEGSWLEWGVRGLVCVALLTSVSSMVQAGPRVYSAMAEHGMFPARFRLARGGTAWAVWLQGGLAAVVCCFAEVQGLLGYLGLTLSLCAALTVGALVALRRRLGARPGPALIWPIAPLVFVSVTLLQSVLMAMRRPAEAIVMVATVVLGALVWWCTTRSAKT